MAWVVLIVSGILEAVWATALGRSEGFTKLWPSVVFFGALVISMGGLAWAMRDISTGTAYAVWVGVGVVLTSVYAIAARVERPTAARLLLLGGIAASVVGLKLVA